MRWLIAVVAGVIVSSSVAWSKEPAAASGARGGVELAQREVPGAAMLFPVGKVTRQELGLESGKFQVQLGERGRAQLGWTTGAPLSVEEAERVLVNPIREAMGLSIAEKGPVRAAGKPGARWVLRNENASMILSVWPCGGREFHLIVVRADEDPAGLERRIRESFVCKLEAGAAAAGAAAKGKPTCARVGTRSEGWAWPDGRFIGWAKCKGVVPTCDAKGKDGEGWYGAGRLIAADRCSSSGVGGK